jgi:V8-like Glu-specific endopeptidase
VWKDRPAEDRWQGTAFLISEWLAVTNNHVLDSPDAAATAGLEFNYEYSEDGKERRVQLLELDPERLFLSEQRDAVAVKTAASAPPGKSRGHLPLIAERGKTQNGDPVNLIHHPAGLHKRITVRESRVLGMDERTLHYSGDTLGGSSGAPVLNDQWEVVGLHFGGRPKRDSSNRRLTVNGALWDPSMPKELIAYDFNVATRVSSLVRELRNQAESLSPEGRDLLLESIGRDT